MINIKRFLLIFLLIFLVTLVSCSPKKENENNKPKETVMNQEWQVRNEYKKDGSILLTVNPEPNLIAGKPFGYVFHFTAPFKIFEGKELAIYAYHKETEEKITALNPIKIKEPSPGYSTLERFTVNFEVPQSGLWRYEVILDNEFYADVVFSIKDK